MPTTSPWASYVAPPESPEITSLLISISPVSVSPSALPSLCVVICWSVAITSPVAALRWSSVPLASPTAVTASPTLKPSLSVVTVVEPAGVGELEHGHVVLGVGADHLRGVGRARAHHGRP